MNRLHLFLPTLVLCSIFAVSGVAGDRVEVARLTPAQQLYVVKQVYPQTQKVGILCNLKKHANVPDRLARISAQLGIKVFIKNTTSLIEIARNFKHLVKHKEVDVIWVLPDEALIVPSSRKYLIKNAIMTKVFLVAPDAEMVQKGATFYAEKANEQIRLHVNRKTLEILAIQLPEELHQTYEIVTQ